METGNKIVQEAYFNTHFMGRSQLLHFSLQSCHVFPHLSLLLSQALQITTKTNVHVQKITEYVQSCSMPLLQLHLFNGLFSRTTWVSQHHDLNEARDDGVLGWQWHPLDHMQTTCTSLQTDNHANTSSVNFYRPNALHDAQPTVL